jgi:hypothetical protein
MRSAAKGVFKCLHAPRADVPAAHHRAKIFSLFACVVYYYALAKSALLHTEKCAFLLLKQ